jgi:secondary thiamine-phosphate synthase enzyme
VKQAHGELRVATRGKGFYDVTRDIRKWVAAQAIQNGLLTVFIRHTSASLTIQENADPDVRRDLGEFFERLVPENTPQSPQRYRHTTEGPDDMPSHIRAALTSTSVSIPVQGGALGLGTWQAIYVFEHRSDPEVRHILLHILGD